VLRQRAVVRPANARRGLTFFIGVLERVVVLVKL
jgi:hypothetical protein